MLFFPPSTFRCTFLGNSAGSGCNFVDGGELASALEALRASIYADLGAFRVSVATDGYDVFATDCSNPVIIPSTGTTVTCTTTEVLATCPDGYTAKSGECTSKNGSPPVVLTGPTATCNAGLDYAAVSMQIVCMLDTSAV